MHQGVKFYRARKCYQGRKYHQGIETLDQGGKCYPSASKVRKWQSECQRWYNYNIVPNHLNPSPDMYSVFTEDLGFPFPSFAENVTNNQ